VTALDSARVEPRRSPPRETDGVTSAFAVVFDTSTPRLEEWMAARVLAAELGERLGRGVELVALGPPAATIGWVAQAEPAAYASAEALAAWPAVLGVGPVVGPHEWIRLPWQRGASSASLVDIDGLSSLATRRITHTEAAVANPLRDAAPYLAVVVESSTGFSDVEVSEIARLATSRQLDVQLIAGGWHESGSRSAELRSSLSDVGADSHLVTALGAEQFLGAVRGARAVVARDEALAPLLRAFNPRTATLGVDSGSSEAVQRTLGAAVDSVDDPLATVGVARALDELAGDLGAFLDADDGASGGEVQLRVLRHRLDGAHEVERALVARLVAERERSGAAHAALRRELDHALAAREAAEDDRDEAEHVVRRSSEHINALETRLANLDQGTVPVPERALWRRVVRLVDRWLFAAFERFRRRVLRV